MKNVPSQFVSIVSNYLKEIIKKILFVILGIGATTFPPYERVILKDRKYILHKFISNIVIIYKYGVVSTIISSLDW